jgi:hypothetical protein
MEGGFTLWRKVNSLAAIKAFMLLERLLILVRYVKDIKLLNIVKGGLGWMVENYS